MITRNNSGKTKAIAATASLMGIGAVLSKGLGLLRDIAVAGMWGTGTEAVAFEAASRLPSLLFDLLLGGGIVSAFIPVFADVLHRHGSDRAAKFSCSYIKLIAILSASVSVAGIILSGWLVRLVAPDISAEATVLAERLSRIMLFMPIFAGLAYVFVGLLQSMGEFTLPSLMSAASNGAVLLYLLVVGEVFGTAGLAVVTVAGWILQAAVMLPRLHALGWRFHMQARLSDPHLARAARNLVPIIAGTWGAPVLSLLCTRTASGFDGGRAITALNYASKLYAVPAGIFIFICANLVFPKLAAAASAGDTVSERQITASAVRSLVFFTAPLSVGMAVLAPQTVSLIYERGMFTSGDTALSASALAGYSAGTVFLGIGEVVTRAFYARGNTRVPIFTSTLSFIAGALLLPPLSRTLGIMGISLAVSAASALSALWGALLLSKEYGGLFGRGDILQMGSAVVFALASGAAVFAVSKGIKSPAAALAVCAPTGAVIYLTLMYITRCILKISGSTDNDDKPKNHKNPKRKV